MNKTLAMLRVEEIMRVGIIADRLDRPLTGIGNYVQNILHEFSQMNINLAFNTINYTKCEKFDNINEIILENPFEGLMNKSYYPWHLYMQLSLRLKPLDLDILHCPESASTFMQIPGIRKIITVYDTTPALFPETFTKGTLLRYKILFPRSVSSADVIVAISNNTKQDLIRHFHVPADKVTVIHLAADSCYRPLSHGEIQVFRDRYKLDYPFILSVGTLEPRKNLSTVIKAFYQMRKKGLRHKLVIAGGMGWKYSTIFQLVADLNLEKDVCFLGYVPKDDLPALYNAADIFCYPSLYEGFGLPPLEAMACGCPVITSNSSSLPEVVGDAGIMIEPTDTVGIASAIDSVLADEGLRQDLIQRGLHRSNQFSWTKCAKETVEIYKKAYSD